MNIDAVLEYIDGEYLSKYEYRAPDFDFAMQTPVTAEKTISYEVREGEEALAHMASAKIYSAPIRMSKSCTRRRYSPIT